jgi:MoaA/NifB/PqqE/SkfB family radical SAM enzyme
METPRSQEVSPASADSCPRMKRLWISTNGFGTKRVEKRIQEILGVLDFRRIDALEVNVSVDGIDETHDKIRGIKGGFKQCIETIRVLKRLAEDNPIRMSIGTVIQPLNLHQIDDIEQYMVDVKGKAYGIELSLKKNKGKTLYSVNYTLARSILKSVSSFKDEIINSGNWYLSDFDRPNNLVITYQYLFYQ